MIKWLTNKNQKSIIKNETELTSQPKFEDILLKAGEHNKDVILIYGDESLFTIFL